MRGLIIHMADGTVHTVPCAFATAQEYARAVARGHWIDIPLRDGQPRGTDSLKSLRTINPFYVTSMEVHR